MTSLNPGPVTTEFQSRAGIANSQLFKGKIMDAATCARIGYNAMRAGRRVVVPGLKSRLMALGTSLAPRRLVTHFAKRLNKDRK